MTGKKTAEMDRWLEEKIRHAVGFAEAVHLDGDGCRLDDVIDEHAGIDRAAERVDEDLHGLSGILLLEIGDFLCEIHRHLVRDFPEQEAAAQAPRHCLDGDFLRALVAANNRIHNLLTSFLCGDAVASSPSSVVSVFLSMVTV